ncbi:hypothetical protein AVEN_227704-1 [Araneus ventricosus]|uniref:Uncharacterized protein n=1 Tax=Araneus ventricosus TaxID=182803 RepID=A0A4Y2M0F8_ARAVE|nr:hypothetical protein AVEN_227704-1 [Araneus ventricosus]
MLGYVPPGRAWFLGGFHFRDLMLPRSEGRDFGLFCKRFVWTCGAGEKCRDRKEDVKDEPRSGRPPTSTTPNNIERVRRMLADVFENDDRRIEDKPRQCEQHYSRTFSKARKAFVNISWRHPPAHSWYRGEGPGASIHFKRDMKGQTALARLSSGHLKTLRFSRGDKKFIICTKYNMIEATPQYLHACVALVHDGLLKRPDFVLEVMKANDLRS